MGRNKVEAFSRRLLAGSCPGHSYAELVVERIALGSLFSPSSSAFAVSVSFHPCCIFTDVSSEGMPSFTQTVSPHHINTSTKAAKHSRLKTEGKFIPGSHKAGISKEYAISHFSEERVASADKDGIRGEALLAVLLNSEQWRILSNPVP